MKPSPPGKPTLSVLDWYYFWKQYEMSYDTKTGKMLQCRFLA
jgi:hypothetical protein